MNDSIIIPALRKSQVTQAGRDLVGAADVAAQKVLLDIDDLEGLQHGTTLTEQTQLAACVAHLTDTDNPHALVPADIGTLTTAQITDAIDAAIAAANVGGIDGGGA